METSLHKDEFWLDNTNKRYPGDAKPSRSAGAETRFCKLLLQISRPMFPCPYCAGYLGRSFQKLLSHIKFIHSHEPNFSITCGDCGKSFRKFASFKSHLDREKKKRELAAGAHVVVGVEHIEEHNEEEGDVVDSEEESEGEGTSIENMTRFLALFILKTKEENQLSQQTVNAITENTEDLVDRSLEVLKCNIESCLRNSAIEIADVEGLRDILEERSAFSQAREPISNEYLQKKYFVENFNFVEPEEIVLSQHAVYHNANGRQRMKLVKETFQYIPVLKTLEALLNQPDVLAEVRNPHVSMDGSIRDYCDGQDFKEHQLFGQYPNSLVLHCYYDDFEVTNPLGAKTKKHKLGAFYFTLGNLRPCYRSVINVIQLVALCKVPLIRQYGIDRILQPFMRDLNLLESDHGVTLRVEGQNRVFRGSIGPFSADNLGAHSLGGFIESFSSLRICRFCMATKQDIQTKFTEEEFQPRTRANHDRHCNLVQNDPLLAPAYGVKRSSILNQSTYFHVVDGLDLDVMHDQLEGVLPLQIKLLLKKYIQVDKFFTIEVLNQRIDRFEYGPVDRVNKPSPIKQQALAGDSGSLSQSAAQMWCLARVLPLLIGDFIPLEDRHWENLLKLLHIEELVFAPRTSVQLAAYLAVLVEEYLDGFGELHERRKIPKQHYMVHYPKHIVRRGPLVRNWAMRFEAKHNYFKKLVGKINNFKNIDCSLARRHQSLQAYLLQSTAGYFLRMSLEVGPGRKSTVQGEGLEGSLHQLDQEISGGSTLASASWVKVYGTRYGKGCVVITGLHRGNPVLGKVSQVLIIDSRVVIFQYQKLQVQEYISHLNAYRVIHLHEKNFVKQTELEDYHPLGIHKGFGHYANQHFVVLKYRVDCML